MRKQTKTIHEAYVTLASNKLRSLLMMIAIAIGVGTLTAVMTIGQGTRDHILELVARHGLDMIMVRPGGTVQIFAPETDRTVVALTTDDTEAIARSVPNVLRTSSVQNERDWDVVFVKYENVYEVRPVVMGSSDGDLVEIVSGLDPGEQYVSENSYVLKADIGKAGATHDH